MGGLQGKTALVTGASSGIGRAVCRELVRRGARVAMVARRVDRLAALEAELGGAALALPGDVTRDRDLKGAAAAARERFGGLDVVLANAGFGVGRTVERLEVADFQRQFETNVMGVLRTLYATLEDLKKTRGVFAVTGSVAAYLPTPGSAAYAMSKAAVRSLAGSLHGELRPYGIAVVLLSPGYVASEIRQVDREGNFRSEYRDPVPTWLQMPAEKAAATMVRAIARRRREAVITAHGKALVFVARHFPRTTALLLSRAPR